MEIELYIGRELWRKGFQPDPPKYMLVTEKDDWVTLNMFFEEREPRKYYLTKAVSFGQGEFTQPTKDE